MPGHAFSHGSNDNGTFTVIALPGGHLFLGAPFMTCWLEEKSRLHGELSLLLNFARVPFSILLSRPHINKQLSLFLFMLCGSVLAREDGKSLSEHMREQVDSSS